jgi:GntR family transcriptional regulator
MTRTSTGRESSRAAAIRGRPVPLWYQIETDVKAKITSGEFTPGSRLPSELELCEAYGVSRITVRHAIANLVAQGLVVLNRGKGTYARDTTLTAGVRAATTSFTEEMHLLGRSASSRVLSLGISAATGSIASSLGLRSGQPVVVIKRLRLGDGEIVGLQTAHIPAHLVPGLETADLENESLYGVLEERYGIVAVDAVETFRVRRATAEEAELLRIEGDDSVFSVSRVASSRTGPFEAVDSAMRGDRYQVRLFLRASV